MFHFLSISTSPLASSPPSLLILHFPLHLVLPPPLVLLLFALLSFLPSNFASFNCAPLPYFSFSFFRFSYLSFTFTPSPVPFPQLLIISLCSLFSILLFSYISSLSIFPPSSSSSFSFMHLSLTQCSLPHPSLSSPASSIFSIFAAASSSSFPSSSCSSPYFHSCAAPSCCFFFTVLPCSCLPLSF